MVMRRDKFGDQYYTLIGGGIEVGEEPKDALARELKEETGFKLTKAAAVFKEEAGDPFGTQYIYVCECDGDEPILAADSTEAKLNAMGQNIHTPTWLSLGDLKDVTFRSERLKQAIINGIAHGFPDKPHVL